MADAPKYRVEAGFGLFSVWVYSDRAIATHMSEEQARAFARELNAEHRMGSMYVEKAKELDALRAALAEAERERDEARAALGARDRALLRANAGLGEALAAEQEHADARKRIMALEEALRKCEWASAPQRDEGMCPCCYGREPLGERDRSIPDLYGHSTDCELAALLAPAAVSEGARSHGPHLKGARSCSAT